MIPNKSEIKLVPFREAVLDSQYGVNLPSEKSGAYKMLRMGNLQSGRIDLGNLVSVNLSDANLDKFLAKKGDILFNRTNSHDLVGKTSIFDLEGEYTFASYIVRFRVDQTKFSPKFLAHWFNLPGSQANLKLLATKGASQSNINPNNLQDRFLIPKLDLDQQKYLEKMLDTWDHAIELTDSLVLKVLRAKSILGEDFFTSEKSAALKETCSFIKDGTHFSPKVRGGDFKYLTSKNVRFGFLDLSNVETIPAAEHARIFASCPVKRGDVLLTKDGANTGNAAINTLDEPFSLLSSVAVLRGREGLLDNNFLLQYLLSPKGQQRMKAAMEGQAITRLTLTKINEFTIPEISFDTQVKVGRYLSEMDNFISLLRAQSDGYRLQKIGIIQKIFGGLK